MYKLLSKSLLQEKNEIAVTTAGFLVLEDERLYLKSTDGSLFELVLEKEAEAQKLSDFEESAIIVHGQLYKEAIQVKYFGAFKTPLDISVFEGTVKKMEEFSFMFV